MLRALDQMANVLEQWAKRERQNGDENRAADWLALRELASAKRPMVDPYLVAERWLTLIAPVFEAHRDEVRRARYILLSDIYSRLVDAPLPYVEVVEAFRDLPTITGLDERVSACIIGVPGGVGAAASF